ncbi:unnamed protein product [Prorocentrum cordatum]|uniref:Uncharacterized protein n=1 Tax=Prorocentrum cordatum TaxID=2364126 RepID=A0ABN9WBP3_9DINO|nr:unnamed protein product [Polarella glacialis]
MAERPRYTPFSTAFWAADRPAWLALPLLLPAKGAEELLSMEAALVGARVAELATTLYREGSLPGLSTWQFEECPEFADGIALWRQAMAEETCAAFTRKLQEAARLAREGIAQIGNLAPKLAMTRWGIVIVWVAARAALVAQSSVAGCVQGLPAPAASARVCRDSKRAVFELLQEVIADSRVSPMYDFDLLGPGVWRGGGRVSLAEEAENEWYRRGSELDIGVMCHQACQLPPEDLNGWRPVVALTQEAGAPEWRLPPQDAPRFVLEKHEWLCVVEPTPLDADGKLLLGGTKVLQMALPPPPEHDLDDPEVIAKIQRGEELGKKHQADGLPGALHGSVGLLYAGLCATEGVGHLAMNAGILGLEGLLDGLLRYGPPVQSLSLADCPKLVDRALLEETLPLAGAGLQVLDLERCALDFEHADWLVECAHRLPGLRRLDLAGNELDGDAAVDLLEGLCEKCAALTTLRLDSNPVGLDREDFRATVAGLLARRGAQVVAGGTINFVYGTDSVVWSPQLKPDPPTGVGMGMVERTVEEQEERLARLQQETEALFADKTVKGERFAVAKETHERRVQRLAQRTEGAKQYLRVDYDAPAKAPLPESHSRRGADAVREQSRPDWMAEL